MGLVARKPVFWVSEKARLNPVCLATGTSYTIETLHVEGLDMNNNGADAQAGLRLMAMLFTCKQSGLLTLRPKQ